MTKTDDASPLPQDIATKLAELGFFGRAQQDSVKLVYSIRKWAGGTDEAFKWFSEQPLPSFGAQTAADLMREGHADAVKSYISRIGAGGFT